MFFKQLYLLLWKNFIIRVRHYARTIIEVIWPILLFSILIAVRISVPAEKMAECHYPARALPSSGLFPWFQTMLCNMDNPCFNQPVPSETPGQVNSPVPPTPGATTGFQGVINTVITETDIVKNPDAFQRDMEILAALYNEIAKPNSTIKTSISSLMKNSTATQESLVAIGLSPELVNALLQSQVSYYQVQQLIESTDKRSIVCDGGELSSTITIPNSASLNSTELCNQLDPIWSILSNDADIMKFFQTKGNEILTQAASNSGEQAADLFAFVALRLPDLNKQFQLVLRSLADTLSIMESNGTSTVDVLTSFLGFDAATGSGFRSFCGHPERISELSSQEGVTAGLSQQLSTGMLNIIGKLNDDSPDSSTFCNKLINTFETNENLTLAWSIFKPILFGKIPYAPDTNITRSIMQQSNQTFGAMAELESLSRRWYKSNGMGLYDFIENSTTVNFLRDLLSSNLSSSEFFTLTERDQLFLSSFLSNNVTSNQDNMVTWKEAFHGINVAILLLQRILSCMNLNKYEGFPDENSLLERSFELLDNNTFWAGIVFLSPTANDTELPKHIKYKIRQDVDDVMRTDFIKNYYWSPGANANSSAFPFYYYTGGFLFIQDMMERGLATIFSNPGQLPKNGRGDYYLGQYLQEFPYPCYKSDLFLEYLSSMMSLLMTLAWIYSVCIIIKNIVYEKEERLKEFMKMMGLGNGVHWIAWFINSFYLMFLSSLLLLAVLRAGNILPYSNPLILLIWMLCFCIATIGQCFLISCFFTKANLAAACGGIIYFMLYVPYNFAVTWEDDLSYGGKIALSLFSTVAFGYGASFVTRYEMSGEGIQFTNWDQSPVPGEEYTFVTSLMMMLADAVIYFLATWYVENVFPGKYGISRPPYFMFTSTYWCGSKKPTDNGTNYANPIHQRGKHLSVETEPDHLPLGVSIQRLTKIYSNTSKVAVDDLTVNFYEGQITSFLGHNGAGKTTTMSILCGLYTPTQGTAYIHGCDIRDNMEKVRQSLGMCPQHNVLFNDLTVEEHLNFYASLRGLSSEDIERGTEKMLGDVNLLHKRDEVVNNLSGGMKRKLSVAIAFIGESKTVILDEPTAGVDPYARRGIWDLLIKYRKGRTIILSTHHMDEADLLGDRIAIISQGKLKCCGSSLYLRSTFGVGYYLTVVKQKTGQKRQINEPAMLKLAQEEDAACNDEGFSSATGSLKSSTSCKKSFQNGADGFLLTANEALDVIRKHVPTARIHEENVGEVTFILPYNAMRDGNYSNLFQSLDDNEISYGLTDTSLEEIFLSVADHPKEESKPDTSCCHIFPRLRRNPSLRAQSHEENVYSNIQLKKVTRLGQDNDVMPDVIEESISTKTGMPLEQIPEEDENDDMEEVIGNGKGSYQVTGHELISQQFGALLTKRFLHARRNRKGIFAQIILPSVFVLIALSLTLILPPFEGQPNLELQPWMYGNDLVTFYSNDNASDPDVTSVANALLDNPGFGTRCVEGYVIKNHVDITSSAEVDEYLSCKPTEDSAWKVTNDTETLSQPAVSPRYESCICSSENDKVLLAECPNGAGGTGTPFKQTNTTDTLLNMTGRDVADWLVKTTDRYLERRFGGLSVGARYYSTFNQSNLQTIFDILGQFGWNETINMQDNITLFLENMWRSQNAKIWFDNNGFHAMPAYLNVMSNGVMRSNLPAGADPAEYAITVYNHPLNYTKQQISQAALAQTAIDTSIAIVVVFAMSFVPASFVVFLIDERVTKAKHLQFISGVDQAIYWIANYVWDMINYMVPALLVIIIFLCFQTDAYVSPRNLPCLILLLVLYGWAITPMMYPFSFVFGVSSTAYVVLTCVNLFIGINTTIATLILDLLIYDDNLQQVSSILKNVFLIFPHFCLGRGMVDMAVNQATADAYARFGVDTFVEPLSFDLAGKNILALLLEGFLFFGLTLLIQYNFFLRPSSSVIPDSLKNNLQSDDDVAVERQRVKSRLGGTEILRIEDLSKVYQKGPFGKSLLAVDRMNLGVSGGECFGLLGVNGAGKTTTFKMLTGDIEASAGNASVNGMSIYEDIRAVQQSSGYCPQFDALNSHLTGFEHLQLYARLRGVPSEEVDNVAQWGIVKLGLKHYAYKTAGTYSGGNKRKLSAAIAFIGCPPVIFLDEPTAGMDPGARRFLWKRILEVLKDKDRATVAHDRCVVLTSHSMEECEALCTRLAIMVNGKFMCIGTPQHLKNKYGKGYTLTVRVSQSNSKLSEVESFLMEAFSGAELKERHHNMLVMQLPPETAKLAEVFDLIENNKASFGIEDYSLSQTTLDEVFVNFAKHQSDGIEENHLQGNYFAENLCGNEDCQTASSMSSQSANKPIVQACELEELVV